MSRNEELQRLAAETLATETLLVALLSRFAVHDDVVRRAIADAFDQAARFLEDQTLATGKSMPPEDLAHSLRVIHELRVATLGDQEQ